MDFRPQGWNLDDFLQTGLELSVIQNRVKLVTILFLKRKLPRFNVLLKRLIRNCRKPLDFREKLVRRIERYLFEGILLLLNNLSGALLQLLFLLNQSFDLLFVWVLKFDPIRVIRAQVVNVVVKVQCRHGVSQIVLTDS